MMRGEIGVNKISHYNYSHTTTPIHQPPHISLPLFSICLHFQTFISAASSWLDCILFLSFHFGLFRLKSTTETGLLVSWLQAWHVDVPLHNKEGNYDTTADGILAFHLERFWMWQPHPMLTIILANFFGFFSLQTMSKIESLALVARPRMQQKALSHAEGIVNHVSCLQELDVVLLLSWTSRLLCLPHSYSFPFSYFFFHRGILDSNCSVEENAFNNSHPQLLTSCMNERMCCKWSVPKCGISI